MLRASTRSNTVRLAPSRIMARGVLEMTQNSRQFAAQVTWNRRTLLEDAARKTLDRCRELSGNWPRMHSCDLR